MHRSLLLSFVLILIACPAYAEITDSKKQAVDELLEVTGMLKVAALMSAGLSQNYIEGMKKMRPDLPENMLDAVGEEVNAFMTEEMESGSFIAYMYPIYDKHFTEDELQQLIAFYETPLGIKTIRVMPEVTQEGMAAGQQWAQDLMPELQKRVQKRMKAEGFAN